MVYWKGPFIVENGISWHYRETMRILIPAILEIVISWDFNTINVDLMVIYPLVIYSLLWKPWPIEIDDKKRMLFHRFNDQGAANMVASTKFWNYP